MLAKAFPLLLVSFSFILASDPANQPVPAAKHNKIGKADATSNSAQPKSKLAYAHMPLSFEPNKGQSDHAARFIARGHGYRLQLDPTGARFQFSEKGKQPRTLKLSLDNANDKAEIAGESLLPGKSNYFPTSDPKTWVTNVPMYSRVHYSAVYSGIDVAFYGSENRLEYDFLVAPGADPSQIRMSFSGSTLPSLNGDGDLIVPEGKGSVHFLKPLVYQLASDGKTRQSVQGRYLLEKKANGEALVTFALGEYDHSRQLVIDPVVDALSFSEYLLGYYYVSGVAADNSGNSYVTGSAYPDYNSTLSAYYAFEVTKFNSSGTLVYTSVYGTSVSNYAYPEAITVDGSGNAYVTGALYSTNTVPTTAGALQTTPNATAYQSFLAVIPASGAAPTYCTYLSGTDTNYTFAQAVAVDSTGKVYVAGRTNSPTFPTTTGTYQTTLANATYYAGFVSKFDPTQSGAASLVYSTFLGTTNNSNNAYLYGIAVDGSGDAYVTGYAANSTYPVTAGAFQYSGYYSTSGGAYVTELNPAGTALVYSAYLGYGYGYGIAVDSTGAAYVVGTVSYADFPTTAGAYQTDYASGFAVKLNPGGATEAYSTFLSGPSGYNSSGVGNAPTIALQNGCASSCNAFIAGQTTTTDFPAINAIQASPGTNTSEAFVVELNATGTGALFSSYLSGNNTGTYAASSSGLYGNTPGIAVDGSGNIFVVGNTNVASNSTSNDFPMTIADTSATASYAFLAKISTSASAGFALVQPTTIAFGNQPVGVSTSVYNGTRTARLSNFSSTAINLSSITVSPSSIFSATLTAGSPGSSTSCSSNTIPAGGYCILDLDFTPNAAGVRTGSVSIASNASNTPTTLTLTGTGIDQGFLQVSQSSLTFSAVVGTPSAAQTVTVTNLGDVTSALTGNIYFSQGTSYAQTNNCPTQLPPGASCAINVTFVPTQPGLLTDVLYAYGSPNAISLSGTATVTGANTSLTLSQPSVQFGPQIQYTTSGNQFIALTNSGTIPVVIQSLVASNASFQVFNYTCGVPPVQLNPGSSCSVYLEFTPQSAGSITGNLAITADGATTNVPLSGTGVASSQSLEFYPSTSLAFPDTPVGLTSGYQLVYLVNTGGAAITVDRAVVSGNFKIYQTNCEGTVLNGLTVDGLGNASNCYVYVEFAPATVAQGLTGGLTFYYTPAGSSTPSQTTVNLSGNGINATGTISLSPNSLSFTSQPTGVTSALQYIYFQNPGNTPVTVSTFTITGANAGDFGFTTSNCGSLPLTLSAGQSNCYIPVQFTPGAAGSRAATLNVASTAGTQTAALSGTGVTASLAIGLTPTSMNLGSLVVAATGPYEYVYLRNTGTQTVTFSGGPAISGTNAADFSLSNSCGISSASTLAAGSSCYVLVRFKPSVAGAESATLTFTDTAGTQTLALSGTGVAATPALSLSDYLISYSTQVVGTTSSLSNYIYFYNNSGAAVTLGTTGVTAQFILPAGYDTCSGHSIANSSSCYVYVEFAPTTAGYATGTLTFNNSSGTPLAGVPTVPLAGYATAQTYTAYLSPTSLNFTAFQVTGTTSAGQYIYLYNTGNTALSVATVTGTDLGLASSTAEFSIFAANGGSDTCSGRSVPAGSSCYVYVTFTPNAAGARTGSISFPVTYSNSSTATLTANLSGAGVAEKDSAVLTPPNVSFEDQTVGVATAYTITVYLNNSGNQPFTVGSLASGGTNPGDFTKTADNCTGNSVAVASSCYVYLTFTPSAAGARSATLSYPVTFKSGATQTLTLPISGNGVTGAKVLQVTPGSLTFLPEIQTQTSGRQTISVYNVGNQVITIGADSITGTNASEFAISTDNCQGTNLAANSGSCSITVTFTPSSSATGAQTATLNIGDNGGGHSVTLTGTPITAAQQIAVSQATLAFGNQPAGSTSSNQVVYFTNQADTAVTVSAALSGSADFAIVTNTCTSSIAARGSCYVSAKFAPPTSAANGAVTGTITETDSASPGTHSISLTGTVVTAGPAVAFTQTSLTFPTQNVGTTSSAQNFSVTNTGTANLTVTAVASTNATEFPIFSDGCSGATLTPNQSCVVSVKFSPSFGGSRTGSITVADNATGSPQSVSLIGTGLGIPSPSFAPTSLTFSNTNLGSSSASQNITLANSGTDTLAISSLALTGVNSGDFSQTNNCGASLAHGASCTITVTFTPTAAGPRGASITVTDNANNISGSTQTIPLTGTGVAVPTAGVSPTSLTFASTNIGVTSAAQTVIITNSGTGALSIASITIGGANSGDFAQTNTCGATLVAPPTATCTISVTFKPTANGSRTATITITDNAGGVSGSTQTVSLTGTGASLPAASLNQATLTFANQNIGSTSAAQTVVLSNSGTGPLTIASIGFTGANPGDFGTTNNCAGSVAAGGSCTISVTFTPTTGGSRSATLTVTDNAGNVSGSTQTVAVTGTGVGAPLAGLSPAGLTFPSTALGTSASPQTVTLTNSGTAPLTISTIIIGGANSGDFTQTTTCGASLAVGSNCTISVSFTPLAAGARAATLYVADNSGGGGAVQNVALAGTAVAVPLAAVSPTSLTFGSQALNTTSSAQTVTLSNAGAVALTISSIAIGGTNSADFATTNNCGGSVAAGSSCTISVTFTPVASGSLTATLTVTDNAGNVNGSTQNVGLSGTGGSSTPAAATFLTTDTTTQGTWTSQYGSDGQVIANDISNVPGYATFSVSGDQTYTWNASTTDPRALQSASGASTGIASTYYSGTSFQFNINLTDGNAHKIALYLLDWDGTARAESISILDASSNAVLSTKNFSNFHNGEYAIWSVKGNVTIQVTQTGGINSVVSGIFFDQVPSATASYVTTDTSTQGTWTSVYGSDGQVIANDVSHVPAYATFSATGDQTYTWINPSTDPRALQTASGASTRIASAYYSSTSMMFNVNLTDGNAHKIALYLLDWDGTARAETISILDATTNAVLSTQTFSSFHNGEYAVWNLKGNVIIKVVQTGGVNAVIAGIFFDPAAAGANYLGTDATTQGTWTGNYGSNGQGIVNDLSNIPAFATFSVTGDQTYTWSSSTTDVRALQAASGSPTRIASAYYSGTNFQLNVNLTDGNTHKISLYLVDWDSNVRAETITISDATTNAVLDTETYSSFQNGEYAAWNVKGNVIITVTKTGGANAVVNGIFFD